jgi:TolB-like protein/tRNA A-37 threonylcarbamoyl transferase component Bud32
MPSRHYSVEELFEAALALPPEAREAFLQGICGNAPELRRPVEELLRADAQAGSFLNTPLLHFETAATTQPDEPHPDRLAHPQQGKTSGGLFRPSVIVAGRFTVNRFIARGGMGEVYEAWDSELKERVAIKTIRPELANNIEILERFRREVKQARAISHPNVCRVHEIFCHRATTENKIWFLSMEFLEGFTLNEYIRHHGPIEPASALELIEQVVHGLSAAHSLGVIHRDLSTRNIMLTSSTSGQRRAVITDFGLALNVLYRDDRIQEDGGQGTPDFMAPEQLKTGEVTYLADEYSLGIVICEMLTGARPVPDPVGSSNGKCLPRLPAKKLERRWERVILRCLEPQPADRFKTVDEVLAALQPKKRSRNTWMWLVMAAALIALIIASWYPFRHATQPTSLAVLPLQNRTGDHSLDYLGAGITEALTNDLTRMPGLQVAAASIARRFRDDDVNPSSAGNKMHVRSVVTGSVESIDGKLRVPVELVDVRTGRQVWGKTYESLPSGIADLQHEISTDLAYRLKVPLDADTTARLKRQYSSNAVAYDAYLKGRFHLAQRSPDDLRGAVSDFQRSVASDANYAPAYAGLADCYSLLAFYGLEKPIPLLKNAMKSSQQALELDSTLGEAYTSRALARTLLNFDWQGAEDDYKRAIELNPTYIQAHAWYALALLMPHGRFAEARGQMAYVQSADPDSPVTIVGLAMVERFAGHPELSIQLLEPRMNGPRPFEPVVETLALSYLETQEGARAIALLRTTPQAPEFAASREALLAVAYARAGEKARAAEALQRTIQKLHEGYFLPYETAIIYTALNDHERALDMLEAAFDERESELVYLNVNPLLATLHSEPRFQNLLTKMSLQ